MVYSISELKIYAQHSKEREIVWFSIDKWQQKLENTEYFFKKYRGAGTSEPFLKKFRPYRYRH